MRKKSTKIEKIEWKPVLVPAALHGALKTLAIQKGMKLRAMVEFKLAELLGDHQTTEAGR